MMDIGVEFVEYKNGAPGTTDAPVLVVRQVKNVKLQRGCMVSSVLRLTAKIEACKIDSAGQFQRALYEREIENYRGKFMLDYEQRWHSPASMGRFLTNWYGHRLIGFVPIPVVNVQTDVVSVIFYG